MKHTTAVAAILILGVLAACSSHQRIMQSQVDPAAIAKVELKQIDSGMRMYREASSNNAFPEQGQISGYTDLVKILSPYVELPESGKQHWKFVSYQSSSPGVYMIHAQVIGVDVTNITIKDGGEIAVSRTRVPPVN
ncbi:hypothetical protein ACFL3H_08165 [Gemmatimonadota bacterium]